MATSSEVCMWTLVVAVDVSQVEYRILSRVGVVVTSATVMTQQIRISKVAARNV